MTARRGIKPAGIAAAALAAWFLLVVVYAWYVHTSFVSRDQWRFLYLVDHYLSGAFNWRELWDSNNEHVKPGYKLLFVLNARFLGLNLMAETYAGLLLLAAGVLLVWREMRVSLGEARHGVAAASSLLAAGLVLMSFNQWSNYIYSLLALGGFAGTLVQLGYFAGLSHMLQREQRPWRLTGLALLMLICILGFSGARGPAVVGTGLVTAAMAWFLAPETRRRILLQALPSLAVGAAAIAVYLLLLNVEYSPEHSARHSPQAVLGNLGALILDPVGSLAYLMGLLGSSLLSPSTLLPALPVGLVCLAILAWTLWRYFARQYWRRSWMPLMLILYSGAFAVEVLVGRFGSGDPVLHATDVPRYVFDTHLWVVSAAWVAGLEWAAADGRRQRWLPAAVLGMLIAAEIVNFGLVWRVAPSLSRGNARADVMLRTIADGRATTDVLPTWLCSSPKLCAGGMATLVRYRLNVADGSAARP